MSQHPKAVELSRPFRESAARLSRNQPRLDRQIHRTLRRLFDRRESLGLHREPIHDCWSSHVYSCRVNLEVRLIEEEANPIIPRAMYVDMHEAAYRWARHYQGSGAEDVELMDRSAVDAMSVEHDSIADKTNDAYPLLSLEQLQYLGPALPGEPDMACIPAKELRNLGLSSRDSDRIRRASPDAKFENYIPYDLLNAIADLYWRYSDLCGDSYESAAANTTSVPMPIPMDPEDDYVTLTSPEQYLCMSKIGLDRYLTTLTEQQRELARTEQRGLLVVQGSGGSGKTTVAVYRLRHLADRIMAQPSLQGSDERRVLYLCYNRTLADVVKQMLRTLYGGEAPQHIEVHTLHQWAHEYLERRGVLKGVHNTTSGYSYRRVRSDMKGAITSLLNTQRQGTRESVRLSASFVADEIEEVIIGRGMTTAEEYLNTDREGRKSGLRQADRQYVWDLYKEWRRGLDRVKEIDITLLPALALWHLRNDADFMPYEAIIVDEAQDITPVGLRLATQLTGRQVSRITIFADAAQSIYRSGFRWKQAELNPRGRQLQRITQNHRNTVQIWEMATSFLEAGSGPDEPDAYVTAKRPTAIGDLPLLLTCPDAQTQVAEVIARIQQQLDDGVSPQTIGVLAGRRKQTELLVKALREAHIPTQTDDNSGRIDITHQSVKALTMHSAKGLDFPHVYLVGLTEGGIPGASPETSADELEDDHTELQRRLLYTAMIRAGRTLTMTTVRGQMHPLIKDIREDVCAHSSVGLSSADIEQ